MAKEQGVFELAPGGNAQKKSADFLLACDTDDALSIIQLTFLAIDKAVRNWGPADLFNGKITQEPDAAITELNQRFAEHSLGYQYMDGKIIKIDSEYTHEEIVKPALALLHEQGFTGPSDEFMKAHEHYRHGRHKEAITEALKAFESTMKAICDARGWGYSATATAKPLIDAVLKNNPIPAPLASSFNAFRAAMESGLPTVRNKLSGHGQGAQPVTVPDYVAEYALNLAASNIVLLVRAHKAIAWLWWPKHETTPPLWRSTRERRSPASCGHFVEVRPAQAPRRQATEGPVFWKWGAEAAQGQCISSGRSSLRRSLDASGDGLCVHRSGP